jgi:hypothetical protein
MKGLYWGRSSRGALIEKPFRDIAEPKKKTVFVVVETFRDTAVPTQIECRANHVHLLSLALSRYLPPLFPSSCSLSLSTFLSLSLPLSLSFRIPLSLHRYSPEREFDVLQAVRRRKTRVTPRVWVGILPKMNHTRGGAHGK